MQIYVMLKRLITKGNYDKDDMINKLDTYYLMGRLTDDEYMELMDMVCPPVVEPPVEDIPLTPLEPPISEEIPSEDTPVTLPSFPDEDHVFLPE